MTRQLADLLSFRRIADIPFDAYMAGLENWELTETDGELCLGGSVVRGPIEHTGDGAAAPRSGAAARDRSAGVPALSHP